MAPVKKRVVQLSKESHDVTEYLRGLGDENIIIKAYKYERYPNKPEWFDDFAIDILKDSSLEKYLMENHGPGSYLVRAVVNGKFVEQGSRVIHLAGDKQTPAAAPAESAGNSTLEFLKLQMQQSKDASNQMLQMLQQFNSQIITMMNAGRQQGPTLTELITAVASLKSATEPGTNRAAVVSELKEMVELTKEFTGAGDKEDGPWSLLASIAPRLLAAGNPPAAAPTATPATAPPAAPSHQVTPLDDREKEQMERLQLLRMLKEKARKNSEVSFWADYIAIQADDGDRACLALRSLVEQFPWALILDGLVKIDAELQEPAITDWFARLYTEMRDETDAPEASADAAHH